MGMSSKASLQLNSVFARRYQKWAQEVLDFGFKLLNTTNGFVSLESDESLSSVKNKKFISYVFPRSLKRSSGLYVRFYFLAKSSSKNLLFLNLLGQFAEARFINYKDEKIKKMHLEKDVVTGLKNHFGLQNDLERTLKKKDEGQSSKQVVFLFLDIDQFKKMNRLYGHTHATKILVEFAQLLKRFARYFEGKAYRYAGDEFIVFFRSQDKIKLKRAVQLFLETIASHHFVKSAGNDGNFNPEIDLNSARISVSIGMDSFLLENSQNPYLELSESILKANFAMFEAKQKGGNCLVSTCKSNGTHLSIVQ